MLKAFLRVPAMVIIVTIGLVISPTIVKQPISLEAYYVNEAASSDVQKSASLLISTEIKAQKDDRAKRLSKFLSSRGSPMSGDSKALVKIADKYGLDWRLLPAIAGVESTYGLFVPAGSYNPYGWNNGAFYFQDWASGSDYVANQINTRWSSMGTITPWAIGPSYAANPNWASRVSANMSSIDSYK
jgi:hypothetical protein